MGLLGAWGASGGMGWSDAEALAGLFADGGRGVMALAKLFSGKGKGFGKMTFRSSDEILPEEWNKALQFLKTKDYEITDESNYYEVDPGERTIYPTIKFQFNVDETN